VYSGRLATKFGGIAQASSGSGRLYSRGKGKITEHMRTVKTEPRLQKRS
jgi:hypothetical protein